MVINKPMANYSAFMKKGYGWLYLSARILFLLAMIHIHIRIHQREVIHIHQTWGAHCIFSLSFFGSETKSSPEKQLIDKTLLIKNPY